MSSARARLNSHHGSGMSGAKNADANKKPDWLCKFCVYDNGEHHRVFGHRDECNRCEKTKKNCSKGVAVGPRKKFDKKGIPVETNIDKQKVDVLEEFLDDLKDSVDKTV